MDISGVKKFLFTGITIDPRNAQHIQNLAYTPPDTGVPDRVKEKIDNAVYGAFSKIWRGMLQVAASGFGKGLLLTAVVVIGAVAVAEGIMAGAGIPMPASGVPLPVDAGIMHGIGKASAFLFGSGLGFATLAVGGSLGAIADVRKHQNNITEEIATSQAKDFAKARGEVLGKGRIQPLAKEGTFTQPQAPSAAETIIMEADNSSWRKQEEERRAEREIVGRPY